MRRPTLVSCLALMAMACGRDAAVPTTPGPAYAKGGGGGPSTKCRIGFELVLDETGRIRSDRAFPANAYTNKVDGVLVSTDGTGLRFDSNTSMEIEASSDVRRVRLDFSGTGYEAVADPSVPKGIDLRLNASATPINWCAMAVGEVKDVMGVLTFVSSAGQLARLSWGWNPAAEGDNHECDNLPTPGGRRLSAVKTSDTTWTVSADSVCLYTGAAGSVLTAVISMPMAFDLTMR